MHTTAQDKLAIRRWFTRKSKRKSGHTSPKPTSSERKVSEQTADGVKEKSKTQTTPTKKVKAPDRDKPLPACPPPPTAARPTLFRRLSGRSSASPSAAAPTATTSTTPTVPTAPTAPAASTSTTKSPTPTPAQPTPNPTTQQAVVLCTPFPPPSTSTPTRSNTLTTLSATLLSLPSLTTSPSSPPAAGNIAQVLGRANPDVLRVLSNASGGNARSVWEALEVAGRQRAQEGKEDREGGVMLSAPLGVESGQDVVVELGEESLPDGIEKGKGKEKEKSKSKQRVVRVFIPSKEKLSFKANWWGFTIYLPPPVLEALNDTHLTAAKRAALLLATLQWLLRQVPPTGLPPQATSTLVLVRRLLPLLSALGAAISAAWLGICSFDQGRGVKLSAAWICPLVLVPSAWEEGDDFPLGLQGVREGDTVQYTGV